MRKLRDIGAAVLAASIAAILASTFVTGQESGVVNATVTPQGVCLILSTDTVDYGTQPFSTDIAPSIAIAGGPQIENCGTKEIDIAASGTDASNGVDLWELVPTDFGTLPTCPAINEFGHGVLSSDGDVDLVNSPSSFIAGFPALALTPTDMSLVMPCSGSSGAGEPMSFSVSFMASIAEGALLLWYPDADGDAYGDAAAAALEAEEAPEGYVGNNSDCNDSDASINPGAEDIPDDGIDQDCDGVDESGVDADADGFTVGGGDCDDTNASVNPAAEEIDGNLIDDDCDGVVDFPDSDSDGLSDLAETNTFGTDPFDADTDGDGAPDGFEVTYISGLDTDADGTPDGPLDADSDGDGLLDGWEPYFDSDGDTLLNPFDLDSNDDGVVDGEDPTYEYCDGVDNDLDGSIDNADSDTGGQCSPW